MLVNFLHTFKRFAGKGRAWKLKDLFTVNSITAFLSISVASRKMLRTIPEQAYPWSCDDEVIPKWEAYFGIKIDGTVPIDQRRRAVITEYVAIGSNAAEYLEFILSKNGFTAQVIENLAGFDMGGTWDVLNIKIASGEIYVYGVPPTQGNFSYIDPVAKPVSIRQWKKVFVIRDLVFPESIDLLKSLLLKYKSSHTVAMLINDDPDSTFWDAELVNELIEPLHVMDSELVVNPLDPVFVFDAELVV